MDTASFDFLYDMSCNARAVPVAASTAGSNFIVVVHFDVVMVVVVACLSFVFVVCCVYGCLLRNMRYGFRVANSGVQNYLNLRPRKFLVSEF